MLDSRWQFDVTGVINRNSLAVRAVSDGPRSDLTGHRSAGTLVSGRTVGTLVPRKVTRSTQRKAKC